MSFKISLRKVCIFPNERATSFFLLKLRCVRNKQHQEVLFIIIIGGGFLTFQPWSCIECWCVHAVIEVWSGFALTAEWVCINSGVSLCLQQSGFTAHAAWVFIFYFIFSSKTPPNLEYSTDLQSKLESRGGDALKSQPSANLQIWDTRVAYFADGLFASVRSLAPGDCI